jgi:hypothetical protein
MMTNNDGLEKFMQRGEKAGKEGYIPFTDFLGPMLWFPYHCAPITGSKCMSPAKDLVCEAKELTVKEECEAEMDGKGNQCVFMTSDDSKDVKAKIFESPLIAYIKQPNNKVQADLVA